MAQPKWKPSKKLITSVLIVTAIAGGVVWFKGISFTQIAEAAKGYQPSQLAMVLAIVVGQMTCMILRFYCLLPSPRVRLPKVALAIAGGQVVNVIFPARAGDVVKAVAMSRDDDGKGMAVFTGAGVILIDKLVDMAALILMLVATGVYRVPQAQKALSIPLWIYAVAFAVILIGAGLARHKLLALKDRLKSWMSQLVSGLSVVGDLPRVALAVAFGAGAWSCEAWAMKSLCEFLGLSLSWAEVFYVLCILNLAIAIPISVANVGPFEAAVAFALTSLGETLPVAIAIATVHHALQILGTAVAACLAWIWDRLTRKGAVMKETDLSSEFRVRSQDKEKAIAYFQGVSSTYDHTVSKKGLSYFRNRERQAVIELSQLDTPGLSVIDVGCGAGFYALLAKEKGHEVWAVDAAPGMVETIRGKVDHAEVADIENFQPGKTFDRVICAGVMDFVLASEKAFHTLSALVAPGGKLIILCPRKGPGGLFYRVEKFFFGMRINVYTVDWYREKGAARNLNIIEVRRPLPTNMAICLEKSP